MNSYDLQYINNIATSQKFVRDNMEKVIRLIDILDFFNRNESLADKLILKGGTGINLTVFNMPRLSVDIDLDFAKNCSREEMLIEKENINRIIIDYMAKNEYSLSPSSKNPHSLDSWMFYYNNAVGNKDSIKIEINYSNRCHIFDGIKVNLSIPYLNNIQVQTLTPIELFASKINALIGRGVPRDIYDVNNMINSKLFSTETERTILKKCILFYLTVGSSRKDNIIPISFDNIPSMDKVDFPEIRAHLLPVIKKGEFFDFNKAKLDIKEYISNLLILTDNEIEYIKNFNNRKYNPKLLFGDSEITKRVLNHPMALWKCPNTHNTLKYP